MAASAIYSPLKAQAMPFTVDQFFEVSFGAFQFDIVQDYGLPVAALLAIFVYLYR